MSEVDVISVGLACPLGLGALETVAAIRTNLRSIYRMDHAEGVEEIIGESARASTLYSLDPDLSRLQRAGYFMRSALAEATAPLGDGLAVAPLYLATPEPRDADGFRLDELGREWSLDVSPSRHFPNGRAGVFEALHAAHADINRGAHPFAIVGGADSLVDRSSLMRLAEASRLLSERNTDGLIPGEGASFIVLARSGAPPPHMPAPLARLGAIVLDIESEPFLAGSSSHADGLTRVLRRMQALRTGPVDAIYSGQTPQSFWAREFAYAAIRNGGLIPESVTVQRAGEALGELGAAAGAIALVQAILGFHPLIPGRRRTSVLPKSTLVYACADRGTIGACLLSAPRG